MKFAFCSRYFFFFNVVRWFIEYTNRRRHKKRKGPPTPNSRTVCRRKLSCGIKKNKKRKIEKRCKDEYEPYAEDILYHK